MDGQSVRPCCCFAQEALVLLMKRVLAEDVSRALRGLVLLNAAVQVGDRRDVRRG